LHWIIKKQKIILCYRDKWHPDEQQYVTYAEWNTGECTTNLRTSLKI